MTRHVFRFLVGVSGAAGAVVELAAADRRHAERVLRLRPGDPLEIADASGAVWAAELLGEGRARLVELRGGAAARSGPTVWLALAGSRSDVAVEKLTELGVRAIGPLRCERSKGTARLDRWERVALAATMQSKGSRPPLLLPPAPVSEVVAAPGSAILLDHEAADAVPFVARSDATLLVGPEAGWTDAERDAARAAGALLCRLPVEGVLRSETAAIVAAALAIASGDLG